MKIASFSILCALLALFAQESSAQRTIRMNLESIVANAGIIVHGTVTGVSQETDPVTQLFVTKLTIAVIENFYGAEGNTITVTMLSGTTKNGKRKLTEMPHYSAGDEIVAMFHAPGSLGLTSPVGMGQGSFRIKGMDKQKYAANDLKNSQLFKGIKNSSLLTRSSWSANAPERIPLSEFTATIRSFVSTLKK